MSTLALTELIGAAVFDAAGTRCGRVRELAMIPQEDRARVAMLIVRTKSGDRMLPSSTITSIEASVRSDVSCSQWATSDGSEGWLLLGRDLLDQQVIDVFGRKVVRVNDVDLLFFFSSRRRHTRLQGDWSSDVCSSDLRRRFEAYLVHVLAVKGEHLEPVAAAVGDVDEAIVRHLRGVHRPGKLLWARILDRKSVV